MNFKDKYNKSQINVAPSKEFLERLEEKMEAEKKKSSIKIISYRLAAAAAAVCVIVGAAVLFKSQGGEKLPEQYKPSSDSSISVLGTGYEKLQYEKGIFADKNNFDDIKELGEKIAEKETILYKSESNKFTDKDKISEEEKNKAAQAVKHAKECAPSKADGDSVYYMALFKDGETVKFIVSGNVLQVNEKSFLIEF